MNKISEHISWADATRSDTAKRAGISNYFSPTQLIQLTKLANKIYEPLYTKFNGNIFISSFFRNAKLNVLIGGVKESQHLANNGAAIDLDTDGNDVTNKQVFDYIKNNLEFDQLIWEFGNKSNPDWVHVSYNEGKNRKEILKSIRKVTQEIIYEPFNK